MSDNDVDAAVKALFAALSMRPPQKRCCTDPDAYFAFIEQIERAAVRIRDGLAASGK